MSNIKDFSSIKSNREITRIYKAGTKWFAKNCTIYYEYSDGKKYAVVTSKKVGNAVVRNRTRRLIKACILTLYGSLDSGNYVFVAKKGFADVSFIEIERNIKWSLKKLGCSKRN